MSCSLCDRIQKKEGLLFEDSDVAALLAPAPASAGHIVVAPKQHSVLLTQVPDWITGKLFTLANKLSISLFEGLGVHGTNLLIPMGEPAGQTSPHVGVHVVPRTENDGINLLWQPRQLSEEEMSAVELKLKDEVKSVGSFQKEPPKPKTEPPKAKKVELKMSEEENHLIRSLKRIP
jgi:histidine triad (HIT) family protein